MANTVNVTLDTGGTTVNVFMQGGILATASNLTVIDGLIVEKGGVAATIEVGDKIIGWIDADTFVAGLVTALPYTTPGNVSSAVQGDIL